MYPVYSASGRLVVTPRSENVVHVGQLISVNANAGRVKERTTPLLSVDVVRGRGRVVGATQVGVPIDPPRYR